LRSSFFSFHFDIDAPASLVSDDVVDSLLAVEAVVPLLTALSLELTRGNNWGMMILE